MLRWLAKLQKDESAAVAATVALSLFGLIAAAGIAFDYARMATLDTELQNAADQAALAAVSQLDGSDGSRVRAVAAAQNLVTNITRLANDSDDTLVDIPTASVVFLTTANAAATSDAEAQRVSVSVAPRSVFYALTPITGLLQSGPMNATALAGMQSSVCNVPPLYMTFGTTEDLTRLDTGTGVLLLGAESSSHFGYLGETGGNLVKEALAWDDQSGPCSDTASVTVKPGAMASVEKGFNTRFASSAGGGGPGKGSDKSSDKGGSSSGGGGDCPIGGTCSAAANTTTFVRDSCHATNNTPKTPVSPCTAIIGNGAWAGQVSGQSRYEKYKSLIGSGYDFASDRRRLTVAVVPFGAFGPGGSGPGVIPITWLDVFVTEPITGTGSDMRFYVEVIGTSSSTVSGRRDVPYLLE